MWDLTQFIYFYCLLLVMFSVILGVLGVGNYRAIDNAVIREKIKEAQEGKHNDDDIN